MASRPPLSHISLKVDGSAVPDAALGDLLEVVVDHSLHLPSMFTLRLLSQDMKWLEDETFREGKKVEISAGEPPAKLLAGKIAGLEPALDTTAPVLVVRGYDLSHNLYRGRHRRSFTQATDSDLAKRLAGESGLRPGTIDDTPEVHEYAFQNNQTNAEFLLERARRLGYELWVEDDALHFRKPAPSGQPTTLAWGKELRDFRARLSTAEQVNEVEVRGWDPKKKEKVVGRATTGRGEPAIGIGKPGADVAKQAWSEAKVAVVDQFVLSPSQADDLAQATLDELASAFVEAEGTCAGNPDLAPGKQVQIEGVGQRFSGTYYVTQAVHTWNKDEGLTTRFVVSGRRDRGVWSLLEEPRAERRVFGVVVGLVTANKDPEGLGRVRVRYPWLSEDDESAWARIASPMAGKERGFFYLPEIDDEVLVAFEHGDIHRPYILGALWNGIDLPPLSPADAVGGDGSVNKRIIKSRAGHTVTLDDTAGGEEITIVDKTGSNMIVFHSPDNSMQIKVQGDLTIEAQGKIILKATTGLEMTSQADFKIEGQSGVDVSSAAQVKVSGQAGAELSSAGQTAVKGTQVGVQGSAAVEIQGALVKLN